MKEFQNFVFIFHTNKKKKKREKKTNTQSFAFFFLRWSQGVDGEFLAQVAVLDHLNNTNIFLLLFGGKQKKKGDENETSTNSS